MKKTIRRSVQTRLKYARMMKNFQGWAANELKRRKKAKMIEKALSKNHKM